jgi:DNA damage-binding protein 1
LFRYVALAKCVLAKLIITFAGAFKEGSLRILANSIDFQEHASIDLQGITGMWPLKMDMSMEFDSILVLSFVQHTRLLSLDGVEVSETEISGFQSDCRTFYCGNVAHDQVVQVTSVSARLKALEIKQLIQ